MRHLLAKSVMSGALAFKRAEPVKRAEPIVYHRPVTKMASSMMLMEVLHGESWNQ